MVSLQDSSEYPLAPILDTCPFYSTEPEFELDESQQVIMMGFSAKLLDHRKFVQLSYPVLSQMNPLVCLRCPLIKSYFVDVDRIADELASKENLWSVSNDRDVLSSALYASDHHIEEVFSI
jgi:hypothetical protein